MATPTKPAYSHGSTGTQPGNPRDYENGDTLDADEFDYYIFETFSTIDSIIDELDTIKGGDDGKADDPHGNEAHTETYAIDGDAQPPQSHGNEAHTSIFAVDGETQPPESHGNAAHNATFAVDGDSQPPETHNNNAHSENYLTSADVDSGVSDINGQSGSVNFYHNDLFGVDSNDHHSRYSDSEASSAAPVQSVNGQTGDVNIDTSGSYFDSDAIDAINDDNNHGSTAQHNYFGGSHSDLSGVSSNDHHSKYSDSEAVSAVESAGDVFFSGNVVTNTLRNTNNVDLSLGFAGKSFNVNGNTITFTKGATASGDNWKCNYDVTVQGALTVNGNKDFIIEHPSNDDKKLRHGTYEGPVSGGLVYRDRVSVEDGTATPDFPEYVLNGDFGDDWTTSLTPVDHFGRAYLDTEEWTVHADEDGEYDVVVFGVRNDENSLTKRGGVTTKNKDETWADAADRAYGGADDVDRVERARSDSSVQTESVQAHARFQRDD